MQNMLSRNFVKLGDIFCYERQLFFVMRGSNYYDYFSLFSLVSYHIMSSIHILIVFFYYNLNVLIHVRTFSKGKFFGIFLRGKYPIL